MIEFYSAKEVADRLGVHSTPRMTLDVYAHVIDLDD